MKFSIYNYDVRKNRNERKKGNIIGNLNDKFISVVPNSCAIYNIYL